MGKELFFISTFNAAEIMKKKIYFAGSIRGGRNFADLYRKMIEHMQITDIILTEHIGQADSKRLRVYTIVDFSFIRTFAPSF